MKRNGSRGGVPRKSNNHGIHPSGISFVWADKLLNSAISGYRVVQDVVPCDRVR